MPKTPKHVLANAQPKQTVSAPIAAYHANADRFAKAVFGKNFSGTPDRFAAAAHTPQHASTAGRPAPGSREAAKAFIAKAQADVKAQVASRRAAAQSGKSLKDAFDSKGTSAGDAIIASSGKKGGGKGNPNHGADGRFD